jgi:hypothetical protein
MVEVWFTRKFAFDLPVERFPNVVERLRGTAARIDEKVRGLAREVLIAREGDAWSIQENIGHLIDLEDLHLGRLDDYLEGKETLRPADLENRRTWEAKHNEASIGALTASFRAVRDRLVARLEDWDPARRGQSALHPRLRQPMRVIDCAFFAAEHDDHHLARVHEIIVAARQR